MAIVKVLRSDSFMCFARFGAKSYTGYDPIYTDSEKGKCTLNLAKPYMLLLAVYILAKTHYRLILRLHHRNEGS